jgi:hypothetical protein
VAELKAQRERFQSQNWMNAVEVLDRLISDHQRLADQTAGLLRARLSVQVPGLDTVVREKQPFVSDDPLAMIDHDIEAHRQMIGMAPAELAKVSLPGARYMLGTGLQAARLHLQLLEQLRADVQAGRREATLGSRSTLEAGGASAGGASAGAATIRQDDVRQVEDRSGKR